jgi:DNA-binding NtrC family response regulator
MPIRLTVLDGPDKGLSLDVRDGSVLVGTSDDCALRLSDDGVSRRHVRLELLGPRVRAVDLGSKNGTKYLGARLDRVDLPIGATLELGRSVLGILPAVTGGLSEHESLGELKGRSASMRKLFALIEQVAPTDVSCVIQGETGTGKELVARTIHARSPRLNAPFVVVECANLSPSLASAVLFGHVRGAFTGAVKDANGLVALANGGTLFLDDVAALSLELQPLLLRVLDTHTYERVGEGQPRTSNFRALASSKEDLSEAVRSGRLRSDLYYRLATITLELPPLRARAEDIPLLAEHFLRQAQPGSSLSPVMLAGLGGWRWPGNVRELKNAMERGAALGEFMSQPEAPSEDFHAARDRVVAAFERNYLISLLQKHKGAATAMAREAGIARSFLYRLFDAHGLSPDDYR